MVKFKPLKTAALATTRAICIDMGLAVAASFEVGKAFPGVSVG